MSLDSPLDELPVVVVREPGRTPLVVVLHQTLNIGRDGPGLLIDDPQASRNHLQLEPTDDGVIISDLGSTNGTFLDGERVAAPTRFLPGSRLRVGATTIELLPASMEVPPLVDAAGTTSIERLAGQVTAAEVKRPPGLKQDATVTIVFTDIESSTEISTSLGDKEWYDLLSAHNDVLRSRVRDHGGIEVKSQGDGFMLAFDSTRRALQAMIECQRDITRTFGGQEPRLSIRIGAHTGEAIADSAGDLYGYHVNLAARIADRAVGGEILVSELLKQIGEARGEFRFGGPRRVQLKGLGGRYAVYPVDWSDSTS